MLKSKINCLTVYFLIVSFILNKSFLINKFEFCKKRFKIRKYIKNKIRKYSDFKLKKNIYNNNNNNNNNKAKKSNRSCVRKLNESN